jgi:hypothetical protein
MTACASSSERLIGLLSRCHDDPDLFNSAILGRPPYWSRQREIAESVCRYRITCAYTGNAIGKDYLVGGIVPWWLATRHESLVVVTGPGQTTLGTVTWKEIRRACEGSRIPLGLKVSQGVKCSPFRATVAGDWQALGYSTTSIERASGQHNRKLLVVVEEASGVEDEIWDAIDSLKYVRLLAIGNPIRADGRFVSLIRQADADRRDGMPPHRSVNAIRVSSRESPDAHLEESPRGLADRTWIADVERRYGRTSLYVRSHVDAEIPVVSADCLLPEGWLDWAASRERAAVPANHPVHASRRISCDLGEGVGRDSSCVLVRDDRGILDVTAGSALGLPEAADLIWRKSVAYGVPQERISYDAAGIGRKFPQYLARHGITKALPYIGEASPISDRYSNLRTEAAWRLHDRLDPQLAPDTRQPTRLQPDFVIPNKDWWPRMREELKALTYSLAGRKTKLLPKEDWCTALGHSPDLADALIQSFAF